MSIKKILACIRKADEMFNLIEDKDKIAVGISGGKDSSLLLYALHLYQYLYQNTYNKSFELIGIHINLGFGEEDISPLKEFFEKENIKVYYEDSKIKDILELNKKNEKIQCSLCSQLKKGAVIKSAKDKGFDKIAFAHHVDDALETLLMNLIYGARFATFDPKMFLTDSQTTFIRPFALTQEAEIKKTAKQLNIPIIKSGCPNDGYTKRQDMKIMLNNLYKEYPAAKKNLITALTNKEQLNLYLNKLENKEY